jgi:hypothetical protein
MRILIVSLWGSPPYVNAQSYRIAKMAKYLRKAGNEVSVVGNRLRAGTVTDVRLLNDMNKYGEVPATLIGRTPQLPRSASMRLMNMLGAPDNLVFSIKRGTRELKKIIDERKIECVVTSNTPSAHIMGARIKQEMGIPWIADLADLWADASNHSPPKTLHRSWQKRLEMKTLSKSDGISYVSESWGSKLRERYPNGKFCLAPNGFDQEEFSAVGQTKQKGAGLTFCYFGTVYQDMDLEFLKAFAEFTDETPSAREKASMNLLGVVVPAKRQEIESLNKTRGNIAMKGLLPHFDMIGEIMSSDFLVYDLGTGDKAKYDTLPSRLPLYIGSEKPTIACTLPGGLADTLFRKFNCWRVVDAGSKGDIRRCFEEAWGLYESGAELNDIKTWNTESASLRWDRIVGEFDRFVREVCG